MSEITAEAVMTLRARTNLPMMRCKKALAEAGGDMDKAIAILKEQVKGLIDKRIDNETKEGRIFVKVSADGKTAAMVEFQCETDPVSKFDAFLNLGNALAEQLLSGPGADSPAELLAQNAPGTSTSMQEMYKDLVNTVGEKFVVNRIAKVNGPVGSYIHHDGKTAVLFQAKGEKMDHPVLRDISMHIAGLKPTATNASDLDPAIVEEERVRLTEEAKASGKKEEFIPKMVEGRMGMFLANQGVLAEQPFAKDESKKVKDVLAEAGFEPVAFTLWVIGQ
jgi:elongation factor Ts